MKIALTTIKILSLVTAGAGHMEWIPVKYQWIGAIAFGVASTLKDGIQHIVDIVNQHDATTFVPTAGAAPSNTGQPK